jgi:hypothetical protein
MKSTSTKDIRQVLDEELAVPLWPTAGRALHLTRGSTYSGAANGDIPTFNVGRLKRVSTSWLRAKLGLDGPSA